MLNEVKLALGLSDNLFDVEINTFIESAKKDLAFGNVDNVITNNSMVKTAMITYCCYMFQLYHGDMERAKMLKSAYDNLKTQMGLNSNYRDWGDCNGN